MRRRGDAYFFYRSFPTYQSRSQYFAKISSYLFISTSARHKYSILYPLAQPHCSHQLHSRLPQSHYLVSAPLRRAPRRDSNGCSVTAPPASMPGDASYLLCAEDAAGAFFDAASTCTTEDDECCSGEEESASSIAELIGGEAEYSPRYDYPDRLRSRSIDPAARAESVAWILKVQEYYGFLPLTAYLAVNYMDRFLSLHRLPQEDGWAMQLLAVTCLSLAAKMEETLVPSLLDLQVDGARYVFEPRTIRRMELLVLTVLNWKLRSVTPFTFIHFFACKVDQRGKHTRYLIARATQMILAAIHDIEFLDHCPSSMAAAAVLCATGETPSLTFVDPGLAVNWCIGLAEEGISSCYQLMQQLVIGNVQRVTTAAAAAVNLCSDEVVSSNSSSTTPPPPKRRKRSPDT